MHNGPRPPQKVKNFKESILKLGPYLKKHLPVIIIALIFSVVGSICTVLGPKFLGEVTSTCNDAFASVPQMIDGKLEYVVVKVADIDLKKINQLGFILIGLYSTSMISSYLCGFLMTGVTQKVSKKLREDISEKINRLPLKYFDSRSYGDVLSRVTNDVDSISQNLNQSITQTISSITMLIGVLVMMLTISWQLTLIAIITVPLSMIFIAIIVGISQKFFRAQQKILGELNGHIEEAYSGHTVIKVFNQEGHNLESFMKLNDKLEYTAWKSQFLSGLMMPIMIFVGNLSYIAVCIAGGNLVVTGVLKDIGSIQSFIQYTRQFNQPIQQLSQIANVFQTCAAASERVFDFLEAEEMEREENKITLEKENIVGNVEFSGVNFGYSEEKQIIFDFNCLVKAGQKVAIVGPTGAGKTTIVNLLMRFYEINSGTIKIDGVDTRSITRENVAKLFGMVLQDTWLFEGTIMDNLKYGNQEATDEEVYKACAACHIDHFINSLSNGFQHVLDENANVSQGQKQLITIARAMIENAPMLILDEATSSVDTRTEILIQKAMDELMKGRTSFVIAHRLSTIKNADIILVMKNGNIIETGNHDVLMEKGGFYKELYNSQFNDETTVEFE